MAAELIEALKARRQRTSLSAAEKEQLRVSFNKAEPPLLRNEPRNKGVTTKIIYSTIAQLAQKPLPPLKKKARPKKNKK